MLNATIIADPDQSWIKCGY